MRCDFGVSLCHHACLDIRNSWTTWYCGIKHHYLGHWWPGSHLFWVNCHSLKAGTWPRSPKPAVTVLPHCLQACMDIVIHELLNSVEIIIIIGAADGLPPSIITPSKLGGQFILWACTSLLSVSRCIVDCDTYCAILYPMSTLADLLRFETSEGPIVQLAKAYCSTARTYWSQSVVATKIIAREQ